MKTCTICGVELTKKTLGVKNILNKEEQRKLFKIRKKSGYCSECSITLLLLDLI